MKRVSLDLISRYPVDASQLLYAMDGWRNMDGWGGWPWVYVRATTEDALTQAYSPGVWHADNKNGTSFFDGHAEMIMLEQTVSQTIQQRKCWYKPYN